MNWPHVHVMINHFPIIGVMFGFGVLAYGRWKESEDLKKMGLYLMVLIALVCIPVFLTGESAEDQLENLHLPGVSDKVIDEHHESGEAALTAFEILGAVALGGLIYFRKKDRLPKPFLTAVLLISVASAGLIMWTANQGGKIRHPEFSDSKAGISTTPGESGQPMPGGGEEKE